MCHFYIRVHSFGDSLFVQSNQFQKRSFKIAVEVEAFPRKRKMNGLSLSELCCLFCCPPCPGRIASKLAFLPPECSYELKADESSSTKFAMTLLDRADWQYTEREKEYFEAFYTRSSRGNRIACLFVRCSTNARWIYSSYQYHSYITYSNA